MYYKYKEEYQMFVTVDTIIIEVLRTDMRTADIFAEAGLHCMGWSGAAFESIGDAAAVHGISAATLVDRLNAYFGN